jgi:hypothetical protein
VSQGQEPRWAARRVYLLLLADREAGHLHPMRAPGGPPMLQWSIGHGRCSAACGARSVVVRALWPEDEWLQVRYGRTGFKMQLRHLLDAARGKI